MQICLSGMTDRLSGSRRDHADHLLIKSLKEQVLIAGATINMVGKMPYNAKNSLLKIQTCPEISFYGKFCTNQDLLIWLFSKS